MLGNQFSLQLDMPPASDSVSEPVLTRQPQQQPSPAAKSPRPATSSPPYAP